MSDEPNYVQQSYAEPSTAPPAASPLSEPPARNLLQRLQGIYFSPGEAFAEIGRAPRVLVPFVLTGLLLMATSYVITSRIGYDNVVKKQHEMANAMMERMNVTLPPERAEEMKRQQEAQLRPENLRKGQIRDAAAAGLTYLVVLLVVAGVFKLFTLIMGASATFKAILSATSYAYLAIGILSFLVTLISLSLKNPDDIDMMNPVASNVGAILTMLGAGLPKFLTGLLAWVDAFGIWRIILLAIGGAAVTHKMKTATAAIPHVLLYVLAALLSAVFASTMG